MNILDKTRGEIKGDAREKKRREEILVSVLGAFRQGGPEAVTSLLTQRMDQLEIEFDAKLRELEKML